MNKIHKFKIIKDLNLTVDFYSGKINVEDILSILKKKKQNSEWSPNYNILVDIREADILLQTEDINLLNNYIENNIFGTRQIAILTKAPLQVVSGTLFEYSFFKTQINVELFSTLPAAINWLGNHINTIHSIEETIDTLRK